MQQKVHINFLRIDAPAVLEQEVQLAIYFCHHHIHCIDDAVELSVCACIQQLCTL